VADLLGSRPTAMGLVSWHRCHAVGGPGGGVPRGPAGSFLDVLIFSALGSFPCLFMGLVGEWEPARRTPALGWAGRRRDFTDSDTPRVSIWTVRSV
jgi:hypothetical protein